MTATRFVIVTLAALGLADAARAGWDSAFQVACFHCRRPRATAYYAPPPAPVVARAPSTAVTHKERECRMEPITVMRPETYQEPVQVQERRSYYEPSTTYTTRSYYDPKTCRTETFSEPTTCMVRKEECNTVTKYIERVRMVPVQTERKVCYERPVTTITQYGPTTKSYECENCELPPAGGNPPRVTVEPGEPQPRIAPTPGVLNQSPPKPMPATPPSQSNYGVPFNARTTSLGKARVEGEVVTDDGVTPRPGAKVVFMSAANFATRVEAVTDAFGQFDAQRAGGRVAHLPGGGRRRGGPVQEIRRHRPGGEAVHAGEPLTTRAGC